MIPRPIVQFLPWIATGSLMALAWVGWKLRNAAGEILVVEYIESPFAPTLALAPGSYMLDAQAGEGLSAHVQFEATPGATIEARLAR